VEGETKIVGKTSKDRREKCPFSTQIQGKYLEKERNAQNDMENKCPQFRVSFLGRQCYKCQKCEAPMIFFAKKKRLFIKHQ
jgi:hypothetical protein